MAMIRDGWRPVTAIGDSGLILAIGPDGSWRVIDGERVREPAADRGLMMLLPLLERRCEQVRTEVADQVPDGFPAPFWDELLEFALKWPTDYWPGLALAWVEDGYPVDRVRDAVAAIAVDQGRPQPLRHRALRLRGSRRGTA
jgi:hypothetical protein